MTILAKPVVANKYWILKDGDQKVGTVESSANGFRVTIKNDSAEFKTIKTLANKTNIRFEEAPEKKKVDATWQVNGFATDSQPFNAVYDVQRRLPMYTTKRKSKSWYCAGWYQICLDGQWVTMNCPKLILLQRYEYRGPAHSAEGFKYE
jgi:hypothetical protein